MTFTTEQISALKADLNRSKVAQRKAGNGMMLSYIEGWWAIAEANRIFGFDGWNRETLELRQLGEPRLVGDKFRVGYMARVRITVAAGVGDFGDGCITRDGCGFGSGIDKDQDQAHESALKEAETDAMKRALMTFGNPFGLALYDKTQAHVSSSVGGRMPPNETPSMPMPERDEPGGRKSAAQAKRDGDNEKMKAEIGALDMKGLADFNTDFDRLTAHLPMSWLDPIRDMLELRFEEINGDAAIRDEEAALDAGFRGAVGGPSDRSLAGNGRAVAA